MMFCLLILAICAVGFVRNRIVYNYRQRILRRIRDLNYQHGEFNGHRYDQFDEVDYDAMLFQFWRPCKSFFEGRDFQV